jgi:hypothetical protein
VVIFLLVIAMVVDGALAALLIGVSGFLFGGGRKVCTQAPWRRWLSSPP